MRRKRLERTAAATLALLLQAGLVAFVRVARESDGMHEADSMDLILIQSIHVAESEQPQIEAKRVPRRSLNPVPVPRRSLAEPTQAPDSGSAISLTPAPGQTVDWAREMAVSAQRIVQQDADREQRGELLDSKPRVLQLPKRPAVNPTEPGTITQLPDGDVRVQLDHRVHCIYSKVPLAEHFDVWAKGRPPKCTRKRAIPEPVNLDAVKPDYLRRPLPEPPANGPLPVLD